MAAGVNFLPWTGPTLRASAALKVPVTDLFQPMIAVQVIGLIYVFAVAWCSVSGRNGGLACCGRLPCASGRCRGDGRAGDKELTRSSGAASPASVLAQPDPDVAVMAVMIGGWVDPVVMFMIGTVSALVLNYPKPAEQRARIDAHAKAALLMAGHPARRRLLHRDHDRHGHAQGDRRGRRRARSASAGHSHSRRSRTALHAA